MHGVPLHHGQSSAFSMTLVEAHSDAKTSPAEHQAHSCCACHVSSFANDERCIDKMMTSNCCGVGRSRLFSSILSYILHCQTGDVTEELQWNPKLTDGLLSTGLSGLFPELSPDLPADGFSPGVLWSDK